jgi:hypothetical protein
MKVSFEAREAAAPALRVHVADIGETEAVEPSRRVVWACTANDNPAWIGTKLTWEVAPDRGGSTVRFTHDGWQQGGPLYDATVEGWQMFINSLQAYLDGGKATPV